MKTEEQRELLTNDLGVATEKAVGFFERNVGLIAAVICAALVLGGMSYWLSTRGSEADEASWTLLRSSQSLEELGNVVDKYKNQPAGHWAQLVVSEANLRTAMPLMFTNRELATADVKSARQGFEELLQAGSVDPIVRERALWGLALCLETTCDGNTDKVIEAYEKLLKDFPDSMFKAVADDRIKTLKKEGSKEFYAWFSKEKPKPPEARPKDFKDESNSLLNELNSNSPLKGLLPGSGAFTDTPDSSDAGSSDAVPSSPENQPGTPEKAAEPAKSEDAAKPDATEKPPESSSPATSEEPKKD